MAREEVGCCYMWDLGVVLRNSERDWGWDCTHHHLAGKREEGHIHWLGVRKGPRVVVRYNSREEVELEDYYIPS